MHYVLILSALCFIATVFSQNTTDISERYVLDTLNGAYIPAHFEDCLQQFDSLLTPNEREMVYKTHEGELIDKAPLSAFYE